MNTIRAALFAAVGLLAFTQDMAPAHAQETSPATIQVVNKSDWTIDCRVYWGSTVKTFSKVAMESTSPTQSIVVSNSERNLVCKRTGYGTSAYYSNTTKFYVNQSGSYNANCALDPSGHLVCSVSMNAAQLGRMGGRCRDTAAHRRGTDRK